MRGLPHEQNNRSPFDRSVRQSKGPTNRSNQTSQVYRCHRHSHLRRHMWGRLMGGRGGVGKSKRDWLSRLLELPNGILSHDAFGRVFAMIDPVQFETCFTQWVQAVNEVIEGQVIAIDGKTMLMPEDSPIAGGDTAEVIFNEGAMNMAVRWWTGGTWI